MKFKPIRIAGLLGAALLSTTLLASPAKGLGAVYAEEDTGSSTDASAYVNENVSTPRLIVTGFSTDPAEVKAGTDFKLTIHLKNTSKQTALYNLLFDLESSTEGESVAFLPSSGSNSIYLEQIAKNGTCDISIMLHAKSDLSQKPYSINIGMKYEDSNALSFDSTASVSIPVKQDARIEFSDLELTASSIDEGDDANLTCSLYNLGKTTLYNVKVNVEGSGLTCSQSFLGNIESGATSYIDLMITGSSVSEGEDPAKMIVSYEDEDGNVSTIEQTFTLTVTPAEQTDGDIYEFTEEYDDQSSHFPVLLAGILILIVILVCVLVIKKKHKKKNTSEEEAFMNEFDRLTKDE